MEKRDFTTITNGLLKDLISQGSDISNIYYKEREYRSQITFFCLRNHFNLGLSEDELMSLVKLTKRRNQKDSGWTLLQTAVNSKDVPIKVIYELMKTSKVQDVMNNGNGVNALEIAIKKFNPKDDSHNKLIVDMINSIDDKCISSEELLRITYACAYSIMYGHDEKITMLLADKFKITPNDLVFNYYSVEKEQFSAIYAKNIIENKIKDGNEKTKQVKKI